MGPGQQRFATPRVGTVLVFSEAEAQFRLLNRLLRPQILRGRMLVDPPRRREIGEGQMSHPSVVAINGPLEWR